MVRHVRGVVGVTNLIEVSPPASEAVVQETIAEALKQALKQVQGPAHEAAQVEAA